MKNGGFGHFDLQDHRKLPWMFGLSCLAVLALSRYLPLDREKMLTVTISLLYAVGGTAGFLHARHTRDVELFRQLFREFDDRYDKLSDDLNEIRNRPKGQSLKDTDYRVLITYFNLCAEEYMYKSAGYICAPVWDAWHNGMCYFDKDPEIHDLWERELQQGSYYGFVLHCGPTIG